MGDWETGRIGRTGRIGKMGELGVYLDHAVMIGFKFG